MRGLEPQQVFKWPCRCVWRGQGLNHLYERKLTHQKIQIYLSRIKEGKKLVIMCDQVIS